MLFAQSGGVVVEHYHEALRPVPETVRRPGARPLVLVGRESLLAGIEELLDASGPGIRMVALHGLGGVGKTSLANELTHRRLDRYRLVWRFAAEDPATLRRDFADLADRLGLRRLGDTNDPISQVNDELAGHAGPWLLVFDNVEDAAAIQPVLPTAGTGHVLLTSRSAHWPPGVGVEVPVLASGEAVGFVLDRTGGGDAVAAAQIVAELGALPLALEQAVAYVNESGTPLATYVTLLRERRAELLEAGQPYGYSGSVATTWNLTFDRLRTTTPDAVALLQILAFLDPDSIPVSMLISPDLTLPDPGKASLDVLAVGKAIAALRAYSMIGSPAGGTVSIHRLVQAVTRDRLSGGRRESSSRIAAGLVEAALPGQPDEVALWPAYQTVLPHALLALDASSPKIDEVVAFLGESGNYEAAVRLQTRVCGELTHRIGAEDPGTLLARRELANWLEHLDLFATRDLLADLVAVRRRVSGDEHPDTLTVRERHADVVGQAESPVRARDLCAELMPIRERVSGPEHRDTLWLLQTFGFWTGQSGDPVAARDIYASLIPRLEHMWGLEHPNTLAAKNQYARWIGESGDPAAARDLFAELISAYERGSGAEHPDALWVLGGFAWYTGIAGDAAAARDLHVALLAARERVSGPEHHWTMVVRAHLAHWTGMAGDAEAARDQVAILVPLRERTLGPEHYNTLVVRDLLAHWTGEAGDRERAATLYASLRDDAERALGRDHPITRKAYEALARIADGSRVA